MKYIPAWIFFYLGHWVSKIDIDSDILTTLYQWLMCTSFRLQIWAGDQKGPWER